MCNRGQSGVWSASRATLKVGRRVGAHPGPRHGRASGSRGFTGAPPHRTHPGQRVPAAHHQQQRGIYLLASQDRKLQYFRHRFATTTQKDLKVSVQQRLALNLQLKPGSTTETVEVSTTVPLMQTEDASVGQVVDGHTINNMALNGRNLPSSRNLPPA